jgi:acyl-CoA reductase-like NAD-dependent aldehyde dehydrogenase
MRKSSARYRARVIARRKILGMTADLPIFVGGQWKSEGAKIEVRSPYDGQVVGTTYQATGADLEEAIPAASASTGTLLGVSSSDRQRILESVARSIRERHEEFSQSIMQEAAKPIRTARAEVDRAVFTFSLAAAEAGRLQDEQLEIPLPDPAKSKRGRLRRLAAGPVAAITPFNFPLNLVAHKLAPAMAIGAPVVLKPAPQTPLTALRLARIIAEAGWPAGALSVLPLSNEDAAKLVGDDRLNVLSFTGSAKVGWELKPRAGKKRVLLELGGNAAVIINKDADIKAAAERCAFGGFTYSGQSCISVQRIYVEGTVFDAFLSEFLPKVKALRCGDPKEEATDCGPLIRESDARRVVEWIGEAVAQGAKLLCGGGRNGAMVEPAVLTGTKPEQRVNSEELFGPAVTVERFDTVEQAVEIVNASRYGLQAGLFTRDPQAVEQVFAALEVGGVMVNDVPTFRSDAMPYGGVKDSGLGREGVRYAMAEMSELRLLVE